MRRVALAPHHRGFRADGLWRDRTIADDARDLAQASPDRVVFPNDPAQPTYAGLLTDAEALAISLADLGLRTGDVVSFQTFNWIEAAVINLAACIGGFVVNPVVPIYRDAEVRQMLADSAAKIFFHPGTGANGVAGFDYAAMVDRLRADLPALAHAIPVRGSAGSCGFAALVAAGRGRRRDWPATDPDAVKLLLYTSGTTGRPKGVLHSHNTLARASQLSFAHWGVQAGDAVLMPSPVTHVSGYSGGLEQPFLSATRSVLMERWDANAALDLIERFNITATVAATPFLVELAEAAQARGVRLPSLRVFACGGAAVPADVVRRANEAFARPCAFRVFGASEVPLVTLGFSPIEEPELAAASDGAAIDYDIRVVDPDGEPVADGAQGEILVRGPAMFLGYADDGQTREAVTKDGFFRTGDLGTMSPRGALAITGRRKDLIIRGGENISAKEIEDVLLRHPAVRQAGVVSMPHARLGEGVCAFIVATTPAPDLAELALFVTANGLARQKCPEHIEFVDDLPMTASGKLRKDVLRARIRELLSARATAPA